MKKLALVLGVILLSLSSCQKDILNRCGTVMYHHIGGNSQYRTYILGVKFNDGRQPAQKDVKVTDNDWVNYNDGDEICF